MKDPITDSAPDPRKESLADCPQRARPRPSLKADCLGSHVREAQAPGTEEAACV